MSGHSKTWKITRGILSELVSNIEKCHYYAPVIRFEAERFNAGLTEPMDGDWKSWSRDLLGSIAAVLYGNGVYCR
jgi:hypothetical protein